MRVRSSSVRGTQLCLGVVLDDSRQLYRDVRVDLTDAADAGTTSQGSHDGTHAGLSGWAGQPNGSLNPLLPLESGR